MSDDTRAAHEEFEGLGFDTIPLKPGLKDPARRAWQTTDTFRQWRDIPQDSNIGLRGGGEASAAFLDCDEKNHPGTYENALRWLASLGYTPGEYPVIQTASLIGRHIYLNFAGTIPGNSRNLSPEFGSGEFRYGPGAFVAAPPSIVDGRSYALIEGDYRQLPRVTQSDILPILSDKDLTPGFSLPHIPRNAAYLLHSQGIDRYPTRSEAEQALILSLINAGHDFNSVFSLFMSNPCAGKFAELRSKSEKTAIRWLHQSFTEAQNFAQSHNSKARQTADDAISWATSAPWPGKTGAVDRSIFIAHASIAYKAGAMSYAASARTLAELAGVSHMTATRSTHRLIATQLLELQREAVTDCANIYQLGHTVTLPKYSIVRKCNTMSSLDAFRWRGLGKSAGEIWVSLQDEPSSTDALARITGRHKKTVCRALERMQTLEMVQHVGDVWQALPVDLDAIAERIGTAGIGERQKEQHRRERRIHRRELELGRNNENRLSTVGAQGAEMLSIRTPKDS